jgi:hypothetical protein
MNIQLIEIISEKSNLYTQIKLLKIAKIFNSTIKIKKIVDPNDDQLIKCPHMKKLKLCGDIFLGSKLPIRFYYLTNLSLYSNNKNSKLCADSYIKDLVYLKKLCIKNYFYITHVAIERLNKLKVLKLGFDYSLYGNISYPKSLEKLIIDGYPGQPWYPQYAKNLENLKILHIYNNNDIDSFGDVTNLEELYIINCRKINDNTIKNIKCNNLYHLS